MSQAASLPNSAFFSVATARASGVSRQLIDAAELHRPTHGVRARSASQTLQDRARALLTVIDQPVAFSHTTAAQLFGWPVPARAEDVTELHVMTRSDRNTVKRADVIAHRGLESRDVTVLDGIPVVGRADTWVDLGQMHGRGRPFGFDDLVYAGDQCLNQGVSIGELVAAVHRRGRPGGKLALLHAVPLLRKGSRSASETLTRLVFMRAGLPEPVLNEDVEDETLCWVACVDLMWRRHRLIAQYQGRRFHIGAERRDADRRLLDLLESLGWTVVLVYDADLKQKERRDALLRRLALACAMEPGDVDLEAARYQYTAPTVSPRSRSRRRQRW